MINRELLVQCPSVLTGSRRRTKCRPVKLSTVYVGPSPSFYLVLSQEHLSMDAKIASEYLWSQWERSLIRGKKGNADISVFCIHVFTIIGNGSNSTWKSGTSSTVTIQTLFLLSICCVIQYKKRTLLRTTFQSFNILYVQFKLRKLCKTKVRFKIYGMPPNLSVLKLRWNKS